MEDKKNNKTQISLSKERKLARKKEIAQMKRNARISRIVTICIVSLLCLGLATFIGYQVYRNKFKVTPSDNYSAFLTENGFIEGVTAKSLVNLGDYKNIKVPTDEVYSEKQMNADIAEVIFEHATLDKESTAAIVNGDNINIDFVGKIDGEEFEGGSTNGSGSNLSIGSDSFIDDFEEQLIGHKIGDTVTVDVTFPEEYPSNETIAGKDATFEVVINGIYPELTDALVKEKLSANATTVDEYKSYLYDKNLNLWLENYLFENSTISSYPEKYTDHLKSLLKFMEIEYYEYSNASYAQILGYEAYGSFEEYKDMSELEYDKSLLTTSKDTAKTKLIYQAILESEGLTVSEDDYISYLESQGKDKAAYEDEVAAYGKGYTLQQMVKTKALDQLKTYVTVE
jgi:trigger factor